MVIMTALAFFGCGSSASRPPDAAGRQVFERGIEKGGSRDRVRLLDFRKSNGVPGVENGVSFYKMEYEVDVEFLDNCKWMLISPDNSSGRWVLESRPTPPAGRTDLYYAFYGGAPGQKGQRAKLTGEIRFQRTEKGWRGPDGQIY
jgi:hypothetical protein